MNYLNLMLHIGAAVEEVEDAKQLISDLLAKKPVGQDAVAFLTKLGELLGDAIFPLPAPLTVDVAEQMIAELIKVLQPMASAMVTKF